MIRFFLALTLLGSANLALADDSELVHKFFKGRRALHDGLSEKIEAGTTGNPYGEHVATALLTNCQVTSINQGNSSTTEMGGNRCAARARLVEAQSFNGVKFLSNANQTITASGADLVAYTGVTSTTLTQTLDANVAQQNGEYYMTTGTQITRDTVASNIFGNVGVVETINVDNTQEKTDVLIETTIGGQTYTAEYHNTQDVESCKVQGQAADCAFVAYLYGYDSGEFSSKKIK